MYLHNSRCSVVLRNAGSSKLQVTCLPWTLCNLLQPLASYPPQSSPGPALRILYQVATSSSNTFMVTLSSWQLSRNILTNVFWPVRAYTDRVTKPIVENLLCELWRVEDGWKEKEEGWLFFTVMIFPNQKKIPPWTGHQSGVQHVHISNLTWISTS